MASQTRPVRSGSPPAQPRARESQTRLREEGRPRLEEPGSPPLEAVGRPHLAAVGMRRLEEGRPHLEEAGRPPLEEAGRPLLEVAECTRAGLKLPTGVAGTPLCWVLGALEAKPHHPPQRRHPCSGSTPAGGQREG